jgi:hypothetical protein
MKEKKEDNYLLYIPRIKHKIWEIRNDKICLIFQHDKVIERLIRWLFKKPYISDIELDDIGSKVWGFIDGKRTVYEIAKKNQEMYGEKFDPSYRRITLFLNYINKKGWISFERGPQK